MEGLVLTLERPGGDQASDLGNLNLSREGTGQGLHLSWGSPSGRKAGLPSGGGDHVASHPPGHAAHRPGPLSGDGVPGSHRGVCRLSYCLHLPSGLRV